MAPAPATGDRCPEAGRDTGLDRGTGVAAEAEVEAKEKSTMAGGACREGVAAPEAVAEAGIVAEEAAAAEPAEAGAAALGVLRVDPALDAAFDAAEVLRCTCVKCHRYSLCMRS